MLSDTNWRWCTRLIGIIGTILFMLLLTTTTAAEDNPFVYETLSIPISDLKNRKSNVDKTNTFEYPVVLFGENHMVVFSFNASFSSAEMMHERKILMVGFNVYDVFDSVLEMINQDRVIEHSIVPIQTRVDFVTHDLFWGDMADQFDFFACDSYEMQYVVWRTRLQKTFRWSDIHILKEFLIPTSIRTFKDKAFDLQSLSNEDGMKVISHQVDMKINFYYNYVRSIYNYSLTNYGFQMKFLQTYLNRDITTIDMIGNISMRYQGTFDEIIELDQVFCYSELATTYYRCGYDTEFTAFALGQIFNYVVILVGILYYIALATVFKTKSIRRRLATPYVVPITVMIGSVLFSPIVSYYLSFLRMVLVLGIFSYSICLYGITTIRLYYIKHIYHILKRAPENQVKIHKILSSETFGIVMSQVLAVFYSLFWLTILVPYLSNLQRFHMNSSIFLFIALFGAQAFIAALIGIIFMTIDVLMNWKTIRKTGKIFSSFEDPFHVRQDLIAYIVIEISLILVLYSSANNSSYDDFILSFFFRCLCFSVMYFLSGFTAIIFEWKRLIKRRGTLPIEDSENSAKIQLESLMTDEDFRALFMSYCEKEHSLENVVMFENLLDLENKSASNGGLVSLEDLLAFVREHFSSVGKFEANLSHTTKREVLILAGHNQSVAFSSLKSIVEYDLLLNMGDTFDRLSVTSEFQRWQLTKDLKNKTL